MVACSTGAGGSAVGSGVGASVGAAVGSGALGVGSGVGSELGGFDGSADGGGSDGSAADTKAGPRRLAHRKTTCASTTVVPRTRRRIGEPVTDMEPPCTALLECPRAARYSIPRRR